MKKIIIIGKTNVGKTLFMINFAHYMGLRRIYINQVYPDGRAFKKEMLIQQAISYLSSSSSFKTQCLQSINLSIPVNKGMKEITITDTSGLCDGIHPSLTVRQSISQTLKRLDDSDVILHFIDISLFSKDNYYTVSEIDKQINSYGKTREGYLLIGNKVDLVDTKAISNIKKTFTNTNILIISSLYKTGFNEVKKFVIRNI